MLPQHPFKAVDRDDILPLQEISLDQWDKPNTTEGNGQILNAAVWSSPSSEESKVGARRVSIYSNGTEELKGYDRVLVLLEYEVPEMAYFSGATVLVRHFPLLLYLK